MHNKPAAWIRASVIAWLFFAMVQLPWWVFFVSIIIAAAWYGGWELVVMAAMFDVLYFQPGQCCSGFLATAITVAAMVLLGRLKKQLF